MVLVALDTYRKRREMMEVAEELSKKINSLYSKNPNSAMVFELSRQLDEITVQFNQMTDKLYGKLA